MEKQSTNSLRSALVVFTAGAFFFYSFIQMTLFSTEAMKEFFMEMLSLETTAELAANGDCLHVVHLSETESEVATCIERYGVRPVAHFNRLGLLESRLLAAHCVQLTDKEIELLARAEVKVSHCAESNMKLASGAAPIPALLGEGVCVSIGTDGPASNNDVDMFAEMSCVAKVHKVVALDPTVMDAVTVLSMATIAGAMALGLGAITGSLEIGKKAGIIIVDMDKPHLTPLYNPYSHLVYAARGNDVSHSIINGRLVMEDRELLTLDLEAIMAKAKAKSRQVLKWLS